MGEETPVTEMGNGEAMMEVEAAPDSEDEVGGEEPEGDKQDSSPWAY